MAKLILISGKAEAGKTLVANIIRRRLEEDGKRVTLLPFASYLKFICKEHFGWDGKKDKAGRQILQHVGTDIVRKRNPNFWVKTVADFLETFGEDFDTIICDDVRFPNEIDYFQNTDPFSYTSIRVVRLNYENSLTEEQRQHASEISLDDYYHFDLHLNSESGIENVEKEVSKWFRQPELSEAFFE